MTQSVADAAPGPAVNARPGVRQPIRRFTVFGGVGVGKSTLIAGLMSESRSDEPTTSPGISKDAGHRYFTSERCTFVVNEMSDRERFTRNMIAGASVSDAAVLFVDARVGVRPQTRRHCHTAALLGIEHILIVINKMDLVDFEETRFDAVVAEIETFAKEDDFRSIAVVPVSALGGDNVCRPSAEMPWYAGPTVLSHLESAERRPSPAQEPFRMPVQWFDSMAAGIRGCSGSVAAGSLRTGDAVGVFPGGKTAHVDQIAAVDGDLDEAVAGQVVTLVLTEDLAISRGDLFASPASPPSLSDQLAAHVVWLADEPLLAGRSYLMRIGAVTATATVTELKHRVNLDTFDQQAAKSLNRDEIGHCNIGLDRVIAFDPYMDSRGTGGFVLSDRTNGRTVGAGMIKFGLRRASNLSWQSIDVDRGARAEIKGQKPCVLWFTGLSGSGKSTIANMVERRLHVEGRHTYILDGDNVRHGLSRDLGFTEADRVENIRRIAEVSRLMVDSGLIVLVAFISPFRSEREMARELFEPGEFCEVFMDTPIDICETRDVKGLYRKARAGELVNFTGIDSPYEPPVTPELRIRPRDGSPEGQAEMVIDFLRRTNAI